MKQSINYIGATPAYIAAYYGYSDVLVALEDLNADLNRPMSDGMKMCVCFSIYIFHIFFSFFCFVFVFDPPFSLYFYLFSI